MERSEKISRSQEASEPTKTTIFSYVFQKHRQKKLKVEASKRALISPTLEIFNDLGPLQWGPGRPDGRVNIKKNRFL